MTPHGPRARILCCALLVITASGLGCNRLGAVDSDPKSASEPRLPFHSDGTLVPSSEAAHPTGAGALPFHTSGESILPAGTLITVRLERALDGLKIRPGDPFAALLVEPVLIGDDVVVTRGARVQGTIESMQPGDVPEIAGYMRMVLTSITIDGKRLPLQTSSLFTRGMASDKTPAVHGVRLPEGRRLTFRLTAPVIVGEQSSAANRQYSAPTTE